MKSSCLSSWKHLELGVSEEDIFLRAFIYGHLHIGCLHASPAATAVFSYSLVTEAPLTQPGGRPGLLHVWCSDVLSKEPSNHQLSHVEPLTTAATDVYQPRCRWRSPGSTDSDSLWLRKTKFQRWNVGQMSTWVKWTGEETWRWSGWEKNKTKPLNGRPFFWGSESRIRTITEPCCCCCCCDVDVVRRFSPPKQRFTERKTVCLAKKLTLFKD